MTGFEGFERLFKLPEGTAQPQSFMLEELLWAGPTAHSQQMVDRITLALDEHQQRGSAPASLRRLRDELRQWERRLAVATRRDELQAERQALGPAYEDCFCLGQGGTSKVGISVRFPNHVIRIAPREEKGTYEMTWSRLCVCPDGIAEGERAQAIRERIIEAYRLECREAGLEASELPVAYLDCTPTTWREQMLAQGADGERLDTLMASTLRWSDLMLATQGQHTLQPGESRRRMLILAGPYGTGKTALAVHLGVQWLEAGRSVAYRRMTTLVSKLRGTSSYRTSPDDVTRDDVVQALCSVDLLILDDLGAETILSEKQASGVVEVLHLLLDTRADALRPTIITTNLTSKELEQRVGERMMQRIMPPAVSHKVVFRDLPNLRFEGYGELDGA